MQNDTSYPPLRQSWYAVVVLMIAYVFSFIDRQILNLLVAPIRHDLAISDTQMSLLMGFSFALFYTVCGLPLGRLADATSRRRLIAAGVFAWSIATAACGLAQRFWQFFFLRMGVGVGEATLSPAAYSLLADSFPKESRATAISVYSMGIYVGSGLAFLLGGLVIRFATTHGDLSLPVIGLVRPWQTIFFMIGLTGALFSLALYSVREPPRHGGIAGGVPLSDVLRYLTANRRAVLLHNLGFSLLAFVGYGAGAWIPSYFIRVHHWSAAQTGVIYGLIVMVFGTLGIVSGGRLADRLARRGRSDAPMRVALWAALASLPCGVAYTLLPDATAAAIALMPGTFFLSMPFGVAPAAIQEMMPNAMRGQASALYLFVVNIIGLGLGPTAVALTTDYVFHDDNMVNWSLLIVGTAAALIAIGLLALSLRPYRETLQRAQSWVSGASAA